MRNKDRIPANSSSRSQEIYLALAQMARQPDVQLAVEKNHDENRWWPTRISDWRLKMLLAGWSTRVSYSMVERYADVVANAEEIGFDRIVESTDDAIRDLTHPIGLPKSRLGYLRSLSTFLKNSSNNHINLHDLQASELIERFARDVAQASYKVAQCATLYARGYHCGVIPVDSGMVSRLGPLLGIGLSKGAIAHEEMRLVLEQNANSYARQYRELIHELNYSVSIPTDAAPTWWVHLVLIYFKRLYCNRPNERLCRRRPACSRLVDCDCAIDDGA